MRMNLPRDAAMITFSDLLTYVKTFDVRHPEMIKVLKTVLLVFSFNAGGTELTDKMESVTLMLIESVSHLDAAVGA